jgi:uncharacterized protein (TIGR04255 family)
LESKPDDKLPEYERPPVSEVVTGLYFNKLPLLMPHFGLLWQEFRKEYPKFEEAPPLVPDPDTSPDDAFLPRVWFTTNDQTGLIQVQQGYFLTNWRQVKREDAYPRYPEVIKVFKNRFGRFQSFLKEYELPSITPVRYELTYVNLFPQNEGWKGFSDIGSILPDLSWRNSPGRFLPALGGMSCAFTFAMSKDLGRLAVGVQSAKRRTDNLIAIKLELSAKGKPQADMDMWGWFDRAHEWIVRGFADLTSQRVQQEVWGRK